MNNFQKGKFGEDAVNKITSNTYLKYWCYPNPKEIHGSKREICDLLILFQKTAIIVSVKNYAFKGNYERYFLIITFCCAVYTGVYLQKGQGFPTNYPHISFY